MTFFAFMSLLSFIVISFLCTLFPVSCTLSVLPAPNRELPSRELESVSVSVSDCDSQRVDNCHTNTPLFPSRMIDYAEQLECELQIVSDSRQIVSDSR